MRGNETNRNHGKWWGVVGIGLGQLMFTLSISIVNVALPTLVEKLEITFALAQWIVLSYLLVSTALVLTAASLGDLLGKKRLYLFGLILFSVSSLWCGLVPSVEWLIVGRTLQGLAGVFLSGLGAAIVTDIVGSEERGRALGIIGTTLAAGIALGPALGGLLINLFNWRAIFIINIPLAIIATLIVGKFVPASVQSQENRHFDIFGTFLIAFTLFCFTLAMDQVQNQGINSKMSLILLMASVIGLVVFLIVEHYQRQPMVNLELFTNLSLSLSLFMTLLVFMVLGGLVFILPFFLEFALSFSPRRVGLLLAFSPTLAALIAPLSGFLCDRFSTRPVSLIGIVLMITGCLLIRTFDSQLTEFGYLVRFLPFGIGNGLFQTPNNTAIMGSVASEPRGFISGLLSLFRTLGQTIGVSFLGTIFAWLSLQNAPGVSPSASANTSPENIITGLHSTMLVAACLLGCAMILNLLVWKQEQS